MFKRKNLVCFLIALPLLAAAMSKSEESSLAEDFINEVKNFISVEELPSVNVPPASEPQSIDEDKSVVAEEKPSEALPESRVAGSVPGTAGLSGEELFQYLHKYVQKGYKTHGYTEAKAYMYGTADNQGCDGKAGILTFYSQICAPGTSSRGDDYKESGDENMDGVVDKYINAEHIWPQSFFGKKTPMVSDLHHLQSTFGTPNNRRSNYKFAMVNTIETKYSTSSGSRLGKSRFEPCDAVKGNVARSVLYFVTKYYNGDIRQKMDYNSFWKQNVEMFLQWNRQDPPDAREMERNNRIEKFQGNRNPFVDDYTLADRIGASVFASH